MIKMTVPFTRADSEITRWTRRMREEFGAGGDLNAAINAATNLKEVAQDMIGELRRQRRAAKGAA